MKRLLLLTAALLVVFSAVCMAVEESLAVREELTGVQEADSTTVYYTFPQFEQQYPEDGYINQFFAQLCELEMLTELFPSLAYTQGDLHVGYEIGRNDERYLCVILHAETVDGAGKESRAVNFARNGVYAGQKIDLMQVLGLENEVDPEALNDTVFDLVWQQVEKSSGNMDLGYLDGLTAETVSGAFDPKWDFRLDKNGNVVFMIQPGEIAAEMEGVLEYPFLPEELLATIK